MRVCRAFNDKTVTEAWSATARAPHQTLQRTGLAPTIGADVHGVDESTEVPQAQFDKRLGAGTPVPPSRP